LLPIPRGVLGRCGLGDRHCELKLLAVLGKQELFGGVEPDRQIMRAGDDDGSAAKLVPDLLGGDLLDNIFCVQRPGCSPTLVRRQ